MGYEIAILDDDDGYYEDGIDGDMITCCTSMDEGLVGGVNSTDSWIIFGSWNLFSFGTFMHVKVAFKPGTAHRVQRVLRDVLFAESIHDDDEKPYRCT